MVAVRRGFRGALWRWWNKRSAKRHDVGGTEMDTLPFTNMPMPHTARLREVCDEHGYTITPGPTWYSRKRKCWVVNVVVIAAPIAGWTFERVITEQDAFEERKSISRIADEFREACAEEVLKDMEKLHTRALTGGRVTPSIQVPVGIERETPSRVQPGS